MAVMGAAQLGKGWKMQTLHISMGKFASREQRCKELAQFRAEFAKKWLQS